MTDGGQIPTSPLARRISQAKATVLDYYGDLDPALAAGKIDEVRRGLETHTAGDRYLWRGMHPFYEQTGVDAVVNTFYQPLVGAFQPLQRRPQIFLAGVNDAHGGPAPATDDGSIWVCQMGHLLGLFDQPWLDIPATRKMCFLRYAEFHRVAHDEPTKIAETALFVDVMGVMAQAGVYPLPPPTGASFVHPGPLTADGILLDPQDPADGARTMAVVNRMIDDLTQSNLVAQRTGNDRVPIDVLRRSWHEDMIWYGPEGIGASYTLSRYQEQHQYPFRFGLADKQFNGHVARFAEGPYACFFGWSNLTNRAVGGFLGLPASDRAADMRVVDVYRRHGDKLAENWVFIDLLHWLSMQDLDVLARLRRQQGLEGF